MSKYLTTQLEIKSLNDREFEGHGSIFGNEDLGGDVVLPGAFKSTLKQHHENGSLPLMFWMHDPSRVAGKWTEMHEDQNGLRVKGVLADTPLGNEIRTLLQMDAVKGLSIGYRTIKDDWDKQGRRLLKELELWEVSVVSLPMNPLAQVAHAKSQLSANGEYVPTAREFEHALRDVGCSQKTAKRIISKVYEGEEERDVAPQQNDEERDALAALESLKDLLIARQIEDTLLKPRGTNNE
jgi:HK97 family phage prohead protease